MKNKIKDSDYKNDIYETQFIDDYDSKIQAQIMLVFTWLAKSTILYLVSIS